MNDMQSGAYRGSIPLYWDARVQRAAALKLKGSSLRWPLCIQYQRLGWRPTLKNGPYNCHFERIKCTFRSVGGSKGVALLTFGICEIWQNDLLTRHFPLKWQGIFSLFFILFCMHPACIPVAMLKNLTEFNCVSDLHSDLFQSLEQKKKNSTVYISTGWTLWSTSWWNQSKLLETTAHVAIFVQQ